MMDRRLIRYVVLVLLAAAACATPRSTSSQPAGMDLPAFQGVGHHNGSITATVSPGLEPTSDIVSFKVTEPLSGGDPTFTGGERDWGPVWRGDGEVLAFARYHGREADIYVWSSEGLVRLTATPRVSEWPTAWSPGGEQILFLRGSGADSRKPRDLFRMNVSTGETRRVTRTGTVQQGADWSADGLIAYSDLDDVYGYDIYVVPVDASEPTQLTATPSDDVEPRFSPDGHSLSWVRAGHGGLPPNELWVMASDGTWPRRLHSAGDYGVILSPEWSPDGRWIAFVKDVEESHEQVFRLRPLDPLSTVERLVRDEMQYLSLDWRPR